MVIEWHCLVCATETDHHTLFSGGVAKCAVCGTIAQVPLKRLEKKEK
jgi:hypothetical protein